ncbi:unnamed protein product [Eruca vesicaria subsp. sativa]|uniref:Uncharacterized protein n=1 Tax=Eruca vesicaria subsp. sativa TaxID=29727 RepID=A0ABC8L5W3_ERUVS|nr:unnamed protein product [Eruca vesicaria subsp. sativa]
MILLSLLVAEILQIIKSLSWILHWQDFTSKRVLKLEEYTIAVLLKQHQMITKFKRMIDAFNLRIAVLSVSVNIQMRNRGCNLAENWFSSKIDQVLRIHKKAEHESADNCALKEENDMICCEKIDMREADKHTICHNCSDAHVHEDSYFDEQKL